MQSGMLELKVQEGGKDELIYQFQSVAEATAQVLFLKEFFPNARFVIQPLSQ